MLKNLFKVVAVLVLLFSVSSAKGYNEQSSLSVSYLTAGEAYIEGYYGGGYVDTDPGFIFKYMKDTRSDSDVILGYYASYTSIGSDNFIEGGFSLKKAFKGFSNNDARAGLSIGYRSLNIESENGDGLAINFSCELDLEKADNMDPFVEFGFITQPAGGNADVDLTWAPIVYIGIGAHF